MGSGELSGVVWDEEVERKKDYTLKRVVYIHIDNLHVLELWYAAGVY